jgi:hypothetical protein
LNAPLDSRFDALISRGDKLFSDKGSLNSLRQEIASHFYPERADFTQSRYLGQDFASELMSSYPVLVRRELGDAFSSILRPSEIPWFETTVEDDEGLNGASRAWLENATRVQRRAMYDRVTQFVRATKEGDHDFAAFGEAVLSVDFDPRGLAMLYRTWHLRDCAWAEGYNGNVDELYINWTPTVSELNKKFRGKLHPNLQRIVEKEPHRKIKCRRIVLTAEDYHDTAGQGQRWPHNWISVYLDLENKHPLEEVSVRTRQHVIPRWQTVSGSQYAHSPATIVGLPDARLIQAMTLTLLEAGEMAVRPPMLAAADLIREDVQNFAGGMTWIDAEYDKRKQDVLRPLNEDKSGLPFGVDFADRIQHELASIFYLNKLTLPPSEREMTAYETRERIKEYLRVARPLFEPAEAEYNGMICEATFEELMPRGAFGSLQEMPEQLSGRKVRFKFESPLHEAVERQDGVTFLEGKQLLKEAMELDGSTRFIGDVRVAVRDALKGIKFKGKWMRDEDVVERMAAELEAEQQAAAQMATIDQGAQAAERLGNASAALAT